MGGTHFLQTGYLLLNRNAPFLRLLFSNYCSLFLRPLPPCFFFLWFERYLLRSFSGFVAGFTACHLLSSLQAVFPGLFFRFCSWFYRLSPPFFILSGISGVLFQVLWLVLPPIASFLYFERYFRVSFSILETIFTAACLLYLFQAVFAGIHLNIEGRFHRLLTTFSTSSGMEWSCFYFVGRFICVIKSWNIAAQNCAIKVSEKKNLNLLKKLGKYKYFPRI